MDTQVIAALAAGAGGLMVGAGAVIGFLLKQGQFPPRGGSNGSSKPLIVEARLSQETEAMMVQMLERLTTTQTSLIAAILANNEAHGDMKTSLALLNKEHSGG